MAILSVYHRQTETLMSNKYLIRLDDACPTMDGVKWQRMFDVLDNYGVHPMVGIIPHNEDPQQEIDAPDAEFWNKAKCWQQKGYAIALHGYNHCYISDNGLKGLNPLWERSEFAGVPLDVQKQKILDGFNILIRHGLKPKYFFAPSHTFDGNTLIALRECSDIRVISDTIATKPYRSEDFVFIPQLGGHCSKIRIPGVWTFCLHPSLMKDEDFVGTESFLQRHGDEFITFDDIDLECVGPKDAFSRILSRIYFIQRTIRRIK